MYIYIFIYFYVYIKPTQSSQEKGGWGCEKKDGVGEMGVFLASYLSHVFPPLMAGVHLISGAWCPHP